MQHQEPRLRSHATNSVDLARLQEGDHKLLSTFGCHIWTRVLGTMGAKTPAPSSVTHLRLGVKLLIAAI